MVRLDAESCCANTLVVFIDFSFAAVNRKPTDGMAAYGQARKIAYIPFPVSLFKETKQGANLFEADNYCFSSLLMLKSPVYLCSLLLD